MDRMMDGKMGSWINKMDGWKDGWIEMVDGRTDGQTDGWKDRWMSTSSLPLLFCKFSSLDQLLSWLPILGSLPRPIRHYPKAADLPS